MIIFIKVLDDSMSNILTRKLTVKLISPISFSSDKKLESSCNQYIYSKYFVSCLVPKIKLRKSILDLVYNKKINGGGGKKKQIRQKPNDI